MANIIQADAHPGKYSKAHTPRAQELQELYPEFTKWLKQVRRVNDNSLYTYLQALEKYDMMFGNTNITAARLLKYKDFMETNYALKTASIRIGAINMYLKFIKSNIEPLKLPHRQTTYLENVISFKEYTYLLERLAKDKEYRLYFIFRTLGCTGVRAQELVMIQFEHILDGHVDIRSKKKKVRRIYFPKAFREQVKKYVDDGFVDKFDFVCHPRNDKLANSSWWRQYYKNRSNVKSIGAAHLNKLFKQVSAKYGVDPDVMYPHSFRHMFAKAFIAKHKDIALLADLLGHSNIETTRIYLRQTSEEQAALVDEVVTW